MRDGRLFLGPLTKSRGPRNDRLSIARYELSTCASIRAAVGSFDVITTLSKLYLIRRGRKPVIKKPFAVEKYTGGSDLSECVESTYLARASECSTANVVPV